MKYKCPCCGYYTFDNQSDGSYNICEVCFWEDDPIQLEAPTYEGGANKVSLTKAKKNYIEFGACKREMIPYVRKPYLDELSGIVGYTVFERQNEI